MKSADHAHKERPENLGVAPWTSPVRPRARERSTVIGCGVCGCGGTLSWDERWGFVRGDRRQIQTAVLGSADSEEPLMLPLEAIERDAFRRRHEHYAFW
ncbi:hypothetical protein [Streptomyces sp. NBC_00250]|uniref:hypothetical protein n=1 Tax=Streptomyces sp. NBC_00250 TaxID=2903641 RepID=UPI002E2C9D75|nr:hypothetical protein [Streptomyces sp. NBC_00250]